MAASKRNELAGVHDALGIEGLLDGLECHQARRIAQPPQLVALHLADAMFGADRSTRRHDQIMDETTDFLARMLGPGGNGS